MFANVFILLLLVVLAVALAWLTRRATRARQLWVRWPGAILAGLLAVGVAAIAWTGLMGLYRLYEPHRLPVPDGVAPASAEQIARGEHVARVACAGCHSLNGDLPLSGGKNLSADAGLPLGDVYPPNLTPASHLGEMSDGMIFRAIRTGVVDDNRSTVMSTAGTRFLSDDDAWAIVAYLRHAPAVANDTPEFRPSFLLAVMAGARLVNLDPPAAIAPVTAPPKASSAEYGRYVSDYMGCADCHGVNMDGQVKPPAPRGTNLRAAMPHWTKDEFFAAMRTGVDPGGQPIDAVMPWRSSAQLDDAELEALYQYLHGLSPLAGQ